MADQMKQESASFARRTAVQQINSKVDTVRNRLAAMEDVSDKAVMLYQSLDDAQKKIADLRLPATVPTLYSGLACQGSNEDSGERE